MSDTTLSETQERWITAEKHLQAAMLSLLKLEETPYELVTVISHLAKQCMEKTEEATRP